MSIEKIDLADERFRISFFFPLEKFITSIKLVGLLNPPLVCEREGRFILVTGWKRILACRKLSLSPVKVMVNDLKDDLENFLLALHDNLASREFSPLEKAEVVKKLKRFGVEKEKIIRDYFPHLGIPATELYYDVYLALAEFESSLKKSIHEKGLPFSSLRAVCSFSPAARKKILPLLFPLSLNKQKELLEWLLDISSRDGVGVEEILEEEEIRNVFSSERLSWLEKAEKVRDAIRKRRFPRLSSMEESFRNLLRRIRWPENVSLQPSPFFEDENYHLSFRFRNGEQFFSTLEKLRKAGAEKEFIEFFR
ncbi:MAG: ParB/RepB/Spo0J family partition protein [Candidatus Aminicenantales bacterium]